MKAQINTTSGSLKVVSFRQFLKLIKVKGWPADTPNLRYWQKGGINFNDPISGFSPMTLPLINKDILEADFLMYIMIEECPKYDLTETVHDISTQSAYNGGRPTHLVRMGSRLWLAANPKDFGIHTNGIGYNIACYNPNASICWSISK